MSAQRFSASLTVSKTFVNDWKNTPGGINPILDRIKSNFMLDVNFDGKEKLVLSGNNRDIIEIAIDTIQNKLKKAKPPDNGITCSLGQNTVEWRFYGEFAVKVNNLFQFELKELQTGNANDAVTVTATPISNQPNCVEIFCPQSMFEGIKTQVKKLEEQCKAVFEEKVSIKRVQFPTVKKFVKDMDSDMSIFCVFDENKYELVVYGRENDNVKLVVDAWKQTIEGRFDGKTKTTEKKIGQPSNPQMKLTAKPGTKLKVETETKLTTINSESSSSVNAAGDQVNSADYKNAVDGKITEPRASVDESRSNEGAAGNMRTGNLRIYESSGQNDIGSSGKLSDSQRHADAPSKEISSELPRQPGKSTGSGSNSKYTFEVGGLKVLVYKESIVEIKGMDAIVNAANDRMVHGGGVAYFISKAAGKSMDDECYDYISKNEPLPVTKNFVSKAGRMSCNGIIHAVGPTWYDYKRREDECAKALYETIMNVLRSTDERHWKKVALSAISSGIFGVPHQLCAEMYVKAFTDFGQKGGGSVREVHFIDINTDILNLVEDAHKAWVKDPKALDFNNGFKYPNAPSYGDKSSTVRVSNKPSFSTGDVRFICEDKTSYGERIFQYRVNDTIDVLIYTGSLTRLDKVDAILCTIGPDLRGGHLAQSVLTAGGKPYEKELNEKGKKLTEGTTFLCKKTGGMKMKGILHIALEQPIRDTSAGQLHRLSLVFQNVAIGADRLKLRSLAMPLVGAGTIKSPAGIQQLCSCLSSTIVSVPNTKTKLLHLKELHLVNRDRTITTALLDQFKQLSGYKPKGSYSGNSKHDQSKRPGDRGGYTLYDKPSAYKPSSTEGWERHQPLNDTASMKQVETKTEETKAKSQAEVTKAPAGSQCIYCHKQAANSLSCGHTFCTACFVPMKTNKECFKCKAGDSNPDDTCPVCMDTFKNPKTLNCGHKLCGICLEQVAKHKPQCPVCGNIFGAVKGTQPDGEMFYRSAKDRLPGYKDCGTIEIFYDFPGGKQGSEHPHPGKPYAGTQRRAFLPDNDEGRKVLKQLRRAFDRRLIFTLGESRTTGKEGKITWNDIHHKTKPDGGTSNFGYPDPTYLSRVQEELTAKGVTE